MLTKAGGGYFSTRGNASDDECCNGGDHDVMNLTDVCDLGGLLPFGDSRAKQLWGRMFVWMIWPLGKAWETGRLKQNNSMT